jgi:hypothetical protein
LTALTRSLNTWSLLRDRVCDAQLVSIEMKNPNAKITKIKFRTMVDGYPTSVKKHLNA